MAPSKRSEGEIQRTVENFHRGDGNSPECKGLPEDQQDATIAAVIEKPLRPPMSAKLNGIYEKGARRGLLARLDPTKFPAEFPDTLDQRKNFPATQEEALQKLISIGREAMKDALVTPARSPYRTRKPKENPKGVRPIRALSVRQEVG